MLRGRHFKIELKNGSSKKLCNIEGLQQGTVNAPDPYSIYNSRISNLFILNNQNSTLRKGFGYC